MLLSEDEKFYAVRICRFLNGIPLGIELAAAWSQMLSFRDIVAAMEQDLGFLTSSLNDMPDRHRSLQAVFERSWDILTAEEKIIFKKLTVFQGGISVKAAQYAAEASAADLSSFRDKFFIHADGVGRYRILEAIRSFVDGKEVLPASEYEKAAELHAAYFAAFSADREDELEGEKQKTIYTEIGEEIENIRAGWQWSVAHRNLDLISKYIECLDSYYILRGWFISGEKGSSHAVKFLKEHRPATAENRDALETVLGRLLSSRGWFCRFLARYDEAEEALRESVAVFRRLGMEKELAVAFYRLGGVLSDQEKMTEAKRHFEESYRIMQKRNDSRSLKSAARALGVFYLLSDDFRKAQELFETCLRFCVETGDRLTRARVLTNLGLVEEALKNDEAAVALHRESLAVFRQIGERTSIVNCLTNLGFSFLSGNRLPESLKCFRESLNLARGIRSKFHMHEALLGLAAVRAREGEKEIALEIAGYVSRQPRMTWTRRRADRLIAELKPEFDEITFLKIMENGKQNEFDHYLALFSDSSGSIRKQAEGR